jgi:hypothetical protein
MKARYEDPNPILVTALENLKAGDVGVLLPFAVHQWGDSTFTTTGISRDREIVIIGANCSFKVATYKNWPCRLLKAGDKIVLGE